jgi:hypothetical protein
MNFGFGFSKSLRSMGFVFAYLALPLSFLTSCGSSSEKPDTGTTPLGNVVLKDENNYKSTTKLTIPSTTTAAGAEIEICWGDLTTDLLKHTIDPLKIIDSVSFGHFEEGLAKKDIQTLLETGKNISGKVQRIYSYTVPHTAGAKPCANLSSFVVGSTPVAPASDYVASANSVYMLTFATGTVAAVGTKSMMFIDPTAGEANTSVQAKGGGEILDFHADLASKPRVEIPLAGPWDVDWSSLTLDGMNNKFMFSNVDELLLAYYKDMTVSQVEEKILDYEIMMSESYRAPVDKGIKHIKLETAKDKDGKAFAGFTDKLNGLWGVFLMCSTCQVPAPLAVGILDPK